MKVDITQQGQVQQLFAGPGKDVDVLVNSAGTMWTKPFAKLAIAGDGHHHSLIESFMHMSLKTITYSSMVCQKRMGIYRAHFGSLQ